MRLIVISAISLAALLAVTAAPLPQGGAPKNLKVIKPDDVRNSMRLATQGLGVRCDFCHVAGDFAADTNPNKLIARQMFEMTLHVNANVAGVKARVTCYTCHRGAHEPVNAPPAAAEEKK